MGAKSSLWTGSYGGHERYLRKTFTYVQKGGRQGGGSRKVSIVCEI